MKQTAARYVREGLAGRVLRGSDIMYFGSAVHIEYLLSISALPVKRHGRAGFREFRGDGK